ncbi:hypothetical protein BGZ96_008140 [Linnemannia gamsii]|uniref:Uncharacterized protein n=1 Tax=Linnemannia gamsii TaxID=64522 RepID=A0ABQ7JYW1_9FUNG|nr:hypothetical protein BGZ96_008140 [Linnemannia gamsii]
MTPQMLQKLSSYQCLERNEENDFSGLFHRHSTTLRSIELSPCWSIKSNTLRTILCECQSLEVFVVIQADSPSHCGIDLVDAVAAPWVCTNLDCQQPSRSSAATAAAAETLAWDGINNYGESEVILTGVLKPYYEREGPIVFTTQEEEQFRLLELFYRQLGQLTQLEFISLRAQLETDEVDWVHGVDHYTAYQRNSMPGMLSLGDSETGRPGFLHLFSGWKKLKSLIGSVALDAPETRRTVQLKEMKYMLAQWPVLCQAEFMQVEDQEVEKSVDGPSALEWLQEVRPDIEIVL